jgi:acyl carrier protein
MTDAEVVAIVQDVARTYLHVETPLTMDTELVDALGLDSLRMITLVAELENRLKVCFDEGDEVGLVTLADLVAVVRRHLP